MTHPILSSFCCKQKPNSVIVIQSHKWHCQHSSFNWVKNTNIYSFFCMNCSAILKLTSCADIEYTDIQRFTKGGSSFVTCKEYDIANIICDD